MQNNRDFKYLRDFGKHFKKIRLEKGFSQEELADIAGTGKNQITLIENGKINATVNTLRNLSKHMGIKVRDFFDF